MGTRFLLGAAALLWTSGAVAGPDSLLWNQMANFGDAIISVNTDAGATAAADDFDVPSGQVWKISEVDVSGLYFNGSGPADSEIVTFYKNKGKTPGRIAAGPFTIECSGATGTFFCILPETVKLKAGTYWVSLVANCDLNTCGQWGWTTNTKVQGHPAAYRNTFAGSKCPDFVPTRRCLGGGPVDMAFQMWGTSSGMK
jgi:hypothetical protein